MQILLLSTCVRMIMCCLAPNSVDSLLLKSCPKQRNRSREPLAPFPLGLNLASRTAVPLLLEILDNVLLPLLDMDGHAVVEPDLVEAQGTSEGFQVVLSTLFLTPSPLVERWARSSAIKLALSFFWLKARGPLAKQTWQKIRGQEKSFHFRVKIVHLAMTFFLALSRACSSS